MNLLLNTLTDGLDSDMDGTVVVNFYVKQNLEVILELTVMNQIKWKQSWSIAFPDYQLQDLIRMFDLFGIKLLPNQGHDLLGKEKIID